MSAPNTTVTHIPEKKYVAPVKTVPATPAKTNYTAPVTKPITVQHPAVIQRPVDTRPVMQHPVIQRPVLQPAVYQPRTTNVTNNYYTTQPRYIERRPAPYYQPRQAPYYTSSYPSSYYSRPSNGFVAGIFPGLLIGSLIGRSLASNGSRPYPGAYEQGYPDTAGDRPTADMSGILTPSQFESVLNAARNAPNDPFYRDNRITADGYKKPSTAEERLQFKQIMYGILKLSGRDIDDGAMLSEKGIAAGDYRDPRKTALPVDHFSDNFGSSRLAAMVGQNADLLKSEYAKAYQQIRQEGVRPDVVAQAPIENKPAEALVAPVTTTRPSNVFAV